MGDLYTKVGIGTFGSYHSVMATGYAFVDSDALAYYTALTSANSGDINTQALYSISLDSFKAAIDVLFLDLKTAGLYTKHKRKALFLGGNSATQSIDLKTKTSKYSFVGSPLHTGNGLEIDGIQNYCVMNESPDAFLVSGDSHAGITTSRAGSGTIYLFGTHNPVFDIVRLSGGDVYFRGNGSTLIVSNLGLNFNIKRHILVSANLSGGQGYVEGLSVGTNSDPSSANIGDVPMIIGASQRFSNQVLYGGSGVITDFSIGEYLTATEVQDEKDIMAAFNNKLNR